jgi:hypothetical protein
MNMRKITLFLILSIGVTTSLKAQNGDVVVQNSTEGWTLMVDNEPFIVNGMNWDYFPIGTTVTYSFWDQSPEFIQNALDNEMSLLQNMGVNSIRAYTGIPKRWITYIYENYGIYTMLNHAFGRYGVTIDGTWMQNTDYADPKVKEQLIGEVTQLARDYKDTPGLLLFLLGNENNYGLFWDGAETEDIPIEDRASTQRARDMYKTFNEAIVEMKRIDTGRPIAICNGDLLFLDIVAEEVTDADIFGTNTYRGFTFTDLFDRVANEYGKPVLLTEFGSDAFNARTMKEDQRAQASYQLTNWKDIYRNAPGMGGADNSIGGYTFQFSDGWWKYGQTTNLDVHDSNASWDNGGYQFDFEEGKDNMNEEWFGIAAKGPTDFQGYYDLYPRAAYYVIKEAHSFDPLAEDNTPNDLDQHFANISIGEAMLKARADKAALASTQGDAIKLSRFTADLRTFNTGGSSITTPESADPSEDVYPNEQGFDHMQSIYFGIEANPAPNVRANVEFNVLGNVPLNPINEVFYENRGRPVRLRGVNGEIRDESINRVAIYNTSFNWDQEYFNLLGFYRTGHYHWAYEGDFFGLYPEANYGPNLDIYNGAAPSGVEITGKKQFNGLKVAFGPELWWGANPAFLLKYSRTVGKTDLTGIFHEDIQQQGTDVNTSFAIPQPKTRRLSLYADREFGKLGLEVGGLWGGQPLNGREFQLIREEGDSTNVYQDEIKPMDNFGGKLKLTYTGGKFNWYAQGAVMGLVAGGGADPTITYTGWRLKDSGSGNQYNFLTGFTYTMGDLQVAPNFLWQKPIEGPIPTGVDAPGRPRNILADPFVVRSNREQIAGEILFTYDPTPGSFFYEWNNNMMEDSKFAASLGIVYRHLPTTQDAAIGILPDGRTIFPFDGAPPAQDLIEVNARIVSKLSRELGIVALVYGGNAQANGSDPRTIERFGLDVNTIYNKLKLNTMVKVNDWGPYDYHRDFNLTFPLQLVADFSTTLGKPDWFEVPQTRLGIRGTFRTLNDFSPRYAPTYTTNDAGMRVPDPTAPGFDNGTEWEISTYIQIDIRN